jgi:parallel beta-helix repeat protein
LSTINPLLKASVMNTRRIATAARLLGVALSGWITTGAAIAATLTVDCGAGEKIQDQVTIAKPGDTILVSGTCAENVTIPSEVVRITLDGQGKTVIQGAPKGDAIFIRGREIMVKGFTLTGGRDGIHLSGAAAGASAIIDGNTIQRTGRQGIHLDQGSIGRIANNVIEDVPAEGIYVLESSNARIGFLISDLGPNTIRNAGTHGIVLRGGSTAWIVGNTIVNSKGSGIWVTRNSQADILANSISGSGANAVTVSQGGGVNFRSEGTARREGANLTDLGSKNAGFGVSCTVGGYVEGPVGTLTGNKGTKEVDNSCVDRLATP